MKNGRWTFRLFCALWIGLFAVPSWSSTAASATAPTADPKKKAEHLEFDDLLVQGKYQHSDEAVTTVEQDKVLDGLLGIRKDFRDRLKQSAVRH